MSDKASLPGIGDPRRNEMLGSLPADAYARISSALRVRDVPAGRILWEAGEPPDYVYFPLTGVIGISLPVSERMVEVAKIGRESAAGLGGGAAAMTRGAMLTEGRIAMLPAAQFRELSNWHKDIGAAAQTACGWIAAQAQQLTACNAVHNSTRRFCRTLLHMDDRSAAGQAGPILLTQDEIATAIGIRRTTLTLEAQDLQAHGLISYRRGRIWIKDRPGVVACACECYRALSPAHWPFRCEPAKAAPEALAPVREKAAATA